MTGGDNAKPVGRGKTQAAGPKTQPYGARKIAHNPAGSVKPLRGKCGAKLRGSKPARYCKRDPLHGKTRCKLHGGATPTGLDSPHIRTGLRSRFLPKGLKERYEQARADQRLMQIREDVALIEALLQTFTGKLKEGKALTVSQEARITNLVEQRRRLIEAEARRLKDLHQMITIDRYLAQMTMVGQVIRKHVTDAQILTALHEDLQRHLLKPADQVETDDHDDT